MNDTAQRDYAVAARLAKIRVELGRRGYDILIGAGVLERFDVVRALFPRLGRLFVVTDTNVERLHGAALRAALQRAGFASETVLLPPGEATKTFATLQSLCESLLSKGIERADVLVAFGGGVIGDLAGFAASVLLRGIDFIQVPTTLLAQVDSSVGGKTGIDTPQGKNLVGSFLQPRAVLADTTLLDTLERRDRLAGYAEIAKYGLLGDAGFFAWLERNWAAVVDRDGPERTGAIDYSCRAKARVVAADERETGERAVLNLGHTFAHALEVHAEFDDILRHGEAVALGMTMAFHLSTALGLCAEHDAVRVRRHMGATGLPVSLAADPLRARNWPAERLYTLMHRDKKTRAGKPRFVLARGIGQALVNAEAPAEAVLATLRAHGAV
jgi:3-dehydroquinate synthase